MWVGRVIYPSSKECMICGRSREFSQEKAAALPSYMTLHAITPPLLLFRAEVRSLARPDFFLRWCARLLGCRRRRLFRRARLHRLRALRVQLCRHCLCAHASLPVLHVVLSLAAAALPLCPAAAAVFIVINSSEALADLTKFIPE